LNKQWKEFFSMVNFVLFFAAFILLWGMVCIGMIRVGWFQTFATRTKIFSGPFTFLA